MTTAMMFDPERIARLHAQTRAALEALQTIRSTDPAADHAIACCRQMALTLSDLWLPMLQQVMSLHSFSDHRRALEGETRLPEPGIYAHHSSRFAPRWAGRARAVEMRRERRRRASGNHAPEDSHIPVASFALTTWTWEGLRTATRDLERAIRRGANPVPSLSALEGVLAAMSSEALSAPTRSLRGLRPDGHRDADAHAALREVVRVLDLLGDPLHRARLGTHLHIPDPSDQLGPLGEGLVTLLNLWFAAGDPTIAPDPLLGDLAASPVLLGMIEPHLGLLEDVPLCTLATSVITSAAHPAARGPQNLTRAHPSAPLPILIEILSREGGPAALGSSGAVVGALLGRPGTPEPHTAARMVAALTSPSDRTERLELLARVVEGIEGLDLDPMVSRALAVTIAPILDDLAPHLDRDLVVVTLREPDRTATVTLGSRADLAATFGRIMRDLDSQMILGIAAGQVVTTRADTAAATLAESEIEALGYIQAQFGEAHKLVSFVAEAREAENRHLALEHGLAISRSKSVTQLVGIATISTGLPLNSLAGLATPPLLAALGVDRPPEIPSVGLDADLDILYSATALQIPLEHPSLRSRLQLASVAPATWTELGLLLEALDASRTPQERSAAMSRITALIQTEPALHSYLTAVRTGSGEL